MLFRSEATADSHRFPPKTPALKVTFINHLLTTTSTSLYRSTEVISKMIIMGVEMNV